MGIFATSLSEEYAIASRVFNLTRDQLFQLSLQSIDYIFAGEEIKQRLRESFKDGKRAEIQNNNPPPTNTNDNNGNLT